MLNKRADRRLVVAMRLLCRLKGGKDHRPMRILVFAGLLAKIAMDRVQYENGKPGGFVRECEVTPIRRSVVGI